MTMSRLVGRARRPPGADRHGAELVRALDVDEVNAVARLMLASERLASVVRPRLETQMGSMQNCAPQRRRLNVVETFYRRETQ